jgi:hypothetical protein
VLILMVAVVQVVHSIEGDRKVVVVEDTPSMMVVMVDNLEAGQ